MPWNGSGVFTRLFSWVADRANNIDITASRMDSDTNDIVSNGINNTLTRDGQGQPTANLPMAGFKHTGAATATSSGDYVVFGGNLPIPASGNAGNHLTANPTGTGYAFDGAFVPGQLAAPSSPVPGQRWHDTTANALKIRDQANTTWMSIATIDETGKTVTAVAAATATTAGTASAVSFIPSGTKMVFRQASAPTGWTQDTSLNDRVLRMVSGAGGGSGGSWSISGFAGANHSHTFSTPDHKHELSTSGNHYLGGPGGQAGSTTAQAVFASSFNGDTVPFDLSSGVIFDVGGSTNGSGSIGVTNDSSWRPSYADVIVATKN